MMKVGIFVFMFTVLIGRIASQCGVETCDNFDLLTQDNNIGLIGLEEVEPLCRIIVQLEICANKYIPNCPFEERGMFEPSLRAAKVICQNTDAYKKAVQCYFEPDVEEEIDICTENLYDNGFDCKNIFAYQLCITTGDKLADYCSPQDIALLDKINTESLHTSFEKYNCPVTTTSSSTTTTTIKTSSASTSLSTTPSTTTTDTNNPSDPGPNTANMKGGAASLRISLLMSIVTMFCIVIANVHRFK